MFLGGGRWEFGLQRWGLYMGIVFWVEDRGYFVEALHQYVELLDGCGWTLRDSMGA